MSKPQFDPEEWARTVPRSNPVRCKMCLSPKPLAMLRRIMPVVRAGKSQASVLQIQGVLAQHAGWEGSVESLRNHLRHEEARAPKKR